jgi:hypothetical protein
MALTDLITVLMTLAPRTIIYGPPGIGKTTFASSAMCPIFLLFEAGQGKLKLKSFPLITSFTQILTYLQMLIDEEHPYRTVVLDSADWMEQIILQFVASEHGKLNIEDIGYAKGYIYALMHWQKILAMLDVLREKKNMQIIITAHSQVKPFNNPNLEPFDRYTLKLHEKAKAKLEEWSDVILFAQTKTHTRKIDTKQGVITRAFDTGERMIYTSEQAGFIAKNRYDLPPELPLDYNAYMNALAVSLSAA